MLRVRSLSKQFGPVCVFENLSFDVEAGEVLAIQGESGVGKTTLLRCICSLEEPDSGDILVEETNLLDQKKAHRTDVGLVFQHYELFVHLNILDNLTLAPLCRGLMDKKTAQEKALSLLKRMGIKEKARQYPHQLSGGQQQRAAIARALMLNPKVLCLDEPTSALDKDSAAEVAHIISSLAEEGMSILLVSHDEHFAAGVADRILLLS